ncbi:MAG: hypothetical protein WC256_05695 [Desulfurivibrionaceae bacterium]|jgi:hypothetical protein
MRNSTVAIFFLLFLSACATCATTYPTTAEDQAACHVSAAQLTIAKGDCTKGAEQINVALSRPTGNTKTKELFTKNPKSQDCYFAYLEKIIADVSNANQANAAFAKLSNVKTSTVLSENQTNIFFEKLEKVVTNGNISGSVSFVLGDKIDNFPELQSPLHQNIILNRSITNLQGKTIGSRPVAALMEYVIRVGVNSVEGKRIHSLLSTLNIRRNEIATVAKVFPLFAKTRKEEITTRVFLQLKNGDRLLRDDLLQALRNKLQGVEWVSASGPKTTTLIIEQVRNDEKTIPERSQSITYAQHEVNLFSAVLLMPKNASYIYEVISGGAEIEYGYVVSAELDGKTIYDEVIRGRVGGEYQRCQNARIQNVFGGVTSASFEANDDMKDRCNGISSISMQDLRNEVLSKVVEGVSMVPTIKLAQKLNLI